MKINAYALYLHHMQKLRLIAPIVFWVGICLLVASCGYQRKNILFKTPQKIKETAPVVVYALDSTYKPLTTPYRHVIKPGDRLQVRFINNYDIGQAAMQSATSTANMEANGESGYLVNYDSTCILPLLGRVNLVGLTRLEAAKKLEQAYSKYVINPLIEVNNLSLTVTVLGEVLNPGKILLDKEQNTLIDALALAGGIKDAGKKKQIKIIRKNHVVLVDLTTINSLHSNDIVIRDGDVVYIEPYGVKAQTEALTTLQSVSFVIITISQLTIITLQLINFTR